MNAYSLHDFTHFAIAVVGKMCVSLLAYLLAYYPASGWAVQEIQGLSEEHNDSVWHHTL